MALLFLMFSGSAAESMALEGKEGACLLNMRRSLAKSEAHASQSEAHRLWREQHAVQMEQLKKSEDVLDDFIKAQKNAGTACSARLMEAKRALDSLNTDSKSLSNQVNSHEEVLETESENLKITKMSIDAVEDEYEADIKECDRLKAEAIKDMKQYEAELKELEQIADPKARYTHKVSVDLPKAPAAKETEPAAKEADTPKIKYAPIQQRSLLQLSEFTQETCLAFVDFMRRRNLYSFSADPKRACDEQREELQKAFTKAYKDLSDLKDEAEERSLDKSCYEDAVAKKTAALVPLAASQEQATARIEHANDAIAALEPVVSLLKDRIAKLADHIDETLTPECMEAGEVSKILANIRELIVLVEECPGGGNFKLQIPKPVAKEADHCAGMTGYEQICPSTSTWHSSIDTSLTGCVVHVRTEGTCDSYCTGQGRTCLRAQDNSHATGTTGCELDDNHHRKSMENNGCNQHWEDQVCECGPAPKIVYAPIQQRS